MVARNHRSWPVLIALLISLATLWPDMTTAGYGTWYAPCQEEEGYVMVATTDFGNGGSDVLLVYNNDLTSETLARTWGRVIDESPKALCVDASGDAIVTGQYPMPRYEEYAPTPSFLLKFNSAGQVVWARDIGWSNYTVWLEDVTTDAYSNIYVTGSTWHYDGPPDETGGYPVSGFVFTARFTPAGELTWAKRWNSDAVDWDSGKAIITDGSEVVVAAEHSNHATGNTDTLLLYYNASDGSLMSAIAWGFGNYFTVPVAVAYGPSGNAQVACNLIGEDPDVLLLDFSSSHNFNRATAFGCTKNDYVNDLSTTGSHTLMVGQHQVGVHPPEPGSTYQAPAYCGLALVFVEGVLTDEKLVQLVPSIDDENITSVAALTPEVIFIGGTGMTFASEFELKLALGVTWFPTGGVSYPVAYEDTNCGANYFSIDNAAVAEVDVDAVAANFKSKKNFVNALELTSPPHFPDPLLVADVVSGPAPLVVNLDASGSTIDDGSIAGFSWDTNLYDGMGFEFDTGLTPTYQVTYTEPGEYIASVLVTADDGTALHEVVKITVLPPTS